MEHSVIIGGYNVYEKWGLVAKSRLHVAQPEVKTNYIDVPGGDGQLDYSDILTGKVRYGRRTGSWEFWLKPQERWAEVYTDLLMTIHGKTEKLILTDEPDYFYTGRISVNSFKSEEKDSTIVLDYNLEPYKYIATSTKGYDWLWNDLFDNIIYYGTFDVDGTKGRNLINPSKLEVAPTFICSAQMTVTFDGVDHTLAKGENKSDSILLQPGDNPMVFKGTGRVLVDYSLGKSL